MKSFKSIAIAASVLAAVPLASFAESAADKAMELHNRNGCAACHSVSAPIVGPSYETIAAHYDDADQAVIDGLVEKVRDGSSGTHGQIPMPPHSHLDIEDIRTIVEWIMER